MTPAIISSGLVPNPPPLIPFVPPSRTDWDILFQLLFDELLTPPPSVDLPTPKVIAPIDVVVAPVLAISTSSPSSTTVDQDAPSPSNSQTTPKTQPPVIPNDVEEDNHDIEVAHMGNDPYFGILILEINSDQFSSSNSIHKIVHLDHQISEHNSKWTKDHPLENIIGALERPVSTRLQLHEQALFCYYNAFLTSVDPKNYKDTLTQPCYIEAKIMCSKFKMSMMGKIPFFLGLQISQSLRGIFINQSKYALKSLKKYGFESCDPVDTPIVEKSKLDEDKEGKTIDPLHYRGMIVTFLYLTASRPDLQFAIYISLADADHAGCQDTRRSTSGSIQLLGDRLVSWSSKRSKHIDIRFHFIKEHVENGVIELYFVNTEYQLADIFTKALGRERIEFLINKLGMRSFTPETLKKLADDV
ncbi:retrovirus-related pol polyprotein from transposon TNT 1-94 [Tanacetum coccineum]